MTRTRPRLPVSAWIYTLLLALLALPVTRASAQPDDEVPADHAEAGEDEAGVAPSEPSPQPPTAQAPAVEAQEAGPEIVLPPDGRDTGLSPDVPPLGATLDTAADAPELDLLRGMQEDRFARAHSSAFGGYGELHFNLDMPEDGGDHRTTLDLHRLVLFFAHNFNEDFRFYAEVEVEHAFLAGEGDTPGEIGVEQAYVDWRVAGDALGIRAGVVLVPFGVINQWHEPPIFNGVERPNVDRVVIPTTWREGAVGIFGEPTEGLRYELYVMGGLDPLGFSRSSGIRGGRQHVAKAVTESPAVAGRIEYEPMLGLVAGASLYFNAAGAAADIGPTVPVFGAAADARLRWRGIEARALGAMFHIGDAEELRALVDEDGMPLGIDVGSDILGAYGEIGYNVLQPLDTEHALVPFVRVEYWDTTLAESDDAVDGPGVIDVVFGLGYRPIPQVVFKTDFLLRRPDSGDGLNQWNMGVGWMF